MQKLDLAHHIIRMQDDGTLEIRSDRYDTVTLPAEDITLLKAWLETATASEKSTPENGALFLSHSYSEALYPIAGCADWGYTEYQFRTKRYKSISLYYQKQFVAHLKQWSKHYAEDGDAKVRYTSLQEAVEAHKHDRIIQITDQRAAS